MELLHVPDSVRDKLNNANFGLSPELGDYRIISNGLKYRIEQYQEVGFWIFKNRRWILCEYLNGESCFLYEFDSVGEARKAIRALKINDIAKQRGWKPI